MIYVIFGIVLLGSNLCMMFLAGANADKNYKNGYDQAIFDNHLLFEYLEIEDSLEKDMDELTWRKLIDRKEEIRKQLKKEGK